ncbi:MAG: cation:dicarboxylase symporter family transporter [Clostridiales bacterium]|nr:cation:dicarboxylase symporter family transporter [Clostridiales bacterium]
MDPVSSVFMKLLTALAPVLMFLSIINGFIKGRDGADFSKIGRYIIVRYVAISAIVAAFMTVAMIPAFSFVWDSGPLKISTLNTIGDMMYDLVPGNVITAFSENNIIQMIIMAVFFGAILLGLGDRVGGLNSLADDLYKVFLSATEIVCSMLPIFVFTSLLSVLWKNGIMLFVKLWKPIAVAVASEVLLLLIYLVIIAFKLHVSPWKIIKKITPSFIVGLSTCSSIAAFTKGNEINKKELGIKASYSDLAYPLGISLYEAVFAEFYLCITYYLAQTYHTPVSPVWFVIAGFICLIVSYAAPQVSGGVLICLGVIMTQLNIPGEGLAIAGTLALILDFFSTGAKVASQHMEMILQADHLGMLDREVLRR